MPPYTSHHSSSSDQDDSHRGNSKGLDPSKQAFRETLSSLSLPPGLLSSVLQSYQSNESRLWLIDNSHFMKVKDSHVSRGIEKVDNVTRWEELQETVTFHAEMASKCWIPTKYWLVNAEPSHSHSHHSHHHAHEFSICFGTQKDIPHEMAQMKQVMEQNMTLLDQHPQCPLTRCVHSLATGLAKEAPSLMARDHHVTLMICTQGLATDDKGRTNSKVVREFVDELSALVKLSCVRVIIRLTTDNEKVRYLFNTLDSKFDSIDVLDDFWGESLEVYLHNPWLTYSMGLHRLRESGFAPQVMDELDERPLTLDKIHQLCKMLFLGEDACVDLPHPKANWHNFMRALTILIEKEKPQWNPVVKSMMAWVDLEKLDAIHNPKKGGHSYYHGDDHCHGQQQHSHRDTDQHQNWHQKQQQQPSSDESREPPEQTSHSSQQRTNHSGGQHNYQRSLSHPNPPQHASATSSTTSSRKDLTLPEVLKHWSHQPPSYEFMYPLQHLLVTVPQTFPPTNTKVDPHEYFAKWKTFDKEAFANESGDELKELLKRAVRKAKFFLHPDRLPKDLTENQALLFSTIWDVIAERAARILD